MALTNKPNSHVRPDGFGSQTQKLLNTVVEALVNNKKYYWTDIVFEHAEIENKTNEEWNKELNKFLRDYFIPSNILTDDSSSLIERPGIHKDILDAYVKQYPRILQLFQQYYHNAAPKIFNENGPHIVIHARTLNPTDYERSETSIRWRGYFSKSSNSYQWTKIIMGQLRSIFPNCKMYLSCLDNQQNNISDCINISNMSLVDMMHHMIQADILIMAFSAFSAVASYYRTKPSIMRESFAHPLPPNVIFSSQQGLNNEQMTQLVNTLQK